MGTAQFLDVAPRSDTRVLLLYGLTGRHTPAQPGAPLTECLDTGRFSGHLEAASTLLPRVHLDVDLSPDTLAGAEPIPDLARLRLLLMVTPRGDAALLVDAVLAGDPNAGQVSRLLATTCFDRAALTVAGEPLLDWVSSRAGTESRFGRDVHQIVVCGGSLLRDVLRPARTDQVSAVVTNLVYRGTVRAGRHARMGVRVPPALNSPGVTLVAHGRGVSVVGGWSDPVVNTLGIGALTLVCALGVLQRVRHAAFDALRRNDQAELSSTGDARDLVSALAAQLNELHLDLSFGAEAYLDSVLIPELVVETYQVSLRDTTGVLESLQHTSGMLDRLQAVIEARLSSLTAAASEQQEQRHRVFSLVIAIGSLISLPPALLLAFFGVNGTEVDPDASILDLSRYWPAYLLAWAPFVLLAVAGVVPLHRIRVRSGLLRRHHRQRHSRLDTATPARPEPGTDQEPGRNPGRGESQGPATDREPGTEPVPRQRATPGRADLDVGQATPGRAEPQAGRATPGRADGDAERAGSGEGRS